MSLTISASRVVLASATALAGLVTGLGVGLANSSAANHAPTTAAVSGHTITDVTGDAATGFNLHRLNGRIDHPPTRSEAQAECKEYRKRVKRVRCRADVNRQYADLATLQDTIDFYQRLFD